MAWGGRIPLREVDNDKYIILVPSRLTHVEIVLVHTYREYLDLGVCMRHKSPKIQFTAIHAQLQAAQVIFTNYVTLAKAAWSLHQAEIVHTMRFTPKDAWRSVKILAGGLTSHHEMPTVMRLRLPNGDLATNDAENASVMVPHLARV